MTFAIGHFAFGAGMAALMIAFLLPQVELPRTIIVVGGAWAMLPDMNKVSGHWIGDVVNNGHVGDVFWLHYSIDTYVDTGDTWIVSAGFFVFFIVSIMVYEYRATLEKGPVMNVVPERVIEAFAWASLGAWVGAKQAEE